MKVACVGTSGSAVLYVHKAELRACAAKVKLEVAAMVVRGEDSALPDFAGFLDAVESIAQGADCDSVEPKSTHKY